jgi:DNA-binding XRE family transcriptional regulator
VGRRRAPLAGARKAAGYTQEALAEALHVDRSTVSRWEAGKYAPVPYLWPKLAALLGVTRERLQELFADEEVQHENVFVPLSAVCEVVDVNRRQLLRVLGLASAEVVAVPSVLDALDGDDQERLARVVDAPARVDEATIRHVESMLHAAMRQDDVLGPHAVLDTVLAQRTLVRTLMTECSAGQRASLLSLYGNMSRFAGWLSFDLTHYDTAGRHYEEARLAAHEAEDTDLTVIVLCNLSHLATWRRRARVGVEHATAARNWAKDTDDDLLRSYTADVAARAYSGMGERRACLDALDSAEAGVMDAEPQTPATSFAYFYGTPLLASVRSGCLLQFGDTAQAERFAREALAQIPDSFVRNRAFATIDLAEACLAAGDPEQAAVVLGDGAALAARNRSARLAQVIGRSRTAMREWQETPAVRELDARLASYDLSPTSS